MGILKNYIQKKFGTNEEFSSWDLHKLSGVNHKVVQMILKKMHNRLEIYSSTVYDNHRLYTEEESKSLKIRENNLIDKYNLKQKKFTI